MKHISIALVSTLLVLTSAVAPGVAQQTAEQEPTEKSVESANKELVSRFFRLFNSGDVDAAFVLVSDDVSWWVPGDLPFSGTKTKVEYLGIVAGIQGGQ